ncbi:unnamed protein product, partial [Linum tenue]
LIHSQTELKSSKQNTQPTFPLFPIFHHTTIMSTNNSNNNNNNASSSRWCPTPEQLMILEELYRSGVRTPNAPQIQRITAHLSLYGKIEGKNVFYWFQNHKARDRQKLRRKLIKQLQMQQHNQLCHHHHHHQLISMPQLPEIHQPFDNARRHLLLNYFECPNNPSSTISTAAHPHFHELPNPPLPPHYPQLVGGSGGAVEGGASSREFEMAFTMTKKNQTWNNDEDDHHRRHDYTEHIGFGGCQMTAAAEDNSTLIARMYGTDDRRWITPEAADEGDVDDDMDRRNSHNDNNTIKTLQLFPVTSTKLIEDCSRN